MGKPQTQVGMNPESPFPTANTRTWIAMSYSAKKNPLLEVRRAMPNDLTRGLMASIYFPHVTDVGTEVWRVKKKLISQAIDLAVNGRSKLSPSQRLLIQIQPLCTIPVWNVPVQVSEPYSTPKKTKLAQRPMFIQSSPD